MNHPARPLLLIALTALLGLTACSTYKQAGGEDTTAYLEQRSQQTLASFRLADPSMKAFINNAAGYAVFPKVVKGGAGIGGAHGDGVLYENGRVIGYTELSQGTIGVQLGGQSYSEIIFFEDRLALDEFKRGEMEFAAQASAVAAAKGAAANADYSDGIAIFTLGQEGLMFEASIGGQSFTYRPR